MDGLEPIVTLNVRFQEWEYYDIQRDAQVVQYQAVTDVGTWAAELTIVNELERRKKRKAFQETVLGLMATGAKPHEVELAFD